MKLIAVQNRIKLFILGHAQPIRVWNGPDAGEEALRSRNGLLNTSANVPCPFGLNKNASDEEIDLVLSAMGF